MDKIQQIYPDDSGTHALRSKLMDELIAFANSPEFARIQRENELRKSEYR